MYGLGCARRVLVVDDDRVIADTLAMILSKSGYATKVAYSGEDAIELASRFKPDLLITDAEMRGVTGDEVATRIAGILPSCKVIMFSRKSNQRLIC